MKILDLKYQKLPQNTRNDIATSLRSYNEKFVLRKNSIAYNV